MADAHTPVPIGKAIRSTYLWTIEIGRRHPEGLVATILAFLVVSAIPAVGPALAGFSLIPLMMVSHNEVIRGPAGFNTVSLGPGWRRVLRFFLDEVVLGFILMAIYILPVLLLVALVAALKPKENPSGALVVVLIALPLLMAVVVFLTVAAMRLTLRFPSRSIDAALKWGEAWTIAKGHTFRLIVASSIIGTPVIVLWGVVTLATLGSLFGQWLFFGLVLPLQAMLHSAFLALAYMHCMSDFDQRNQRLVPAE